MIFLSNGKQGFCLQGSRGHFPSGILFLYFPNLKITQGTHFQETYNIHIWYFDFFLDTIPTPTFVVALHSLCHQMSHFPISINEPPRSSASMIVTFLQNLKSWCLNMSFCQKTYGMHSYSYVEYGYYFLQGFIQWMQRYTMTMNEGPHRTLG